MDFVRQEVVRLRTAVLGRCVIPMMFLGVRCLCKYTANPCASIPSMHDSDLKATMVRDQRKQKEISKKNVLPPV